MFAGRRTVTGDTPNEALAAILRGSLQPTS